jgi:hypothetical protein
VSGKHSEGGLRGHGKTHVNDGQVEGDDSQDSRVSRGVIQRQVRSLVELGTYDGRHLDEPVRRKAG